MIKNKLQPDIDLINSREYYGAYNSKDLYKGKSFNMAGQWKANIHYWNDEYVTDFVAFDGALLSCKISHKSIEAPELVYDEQTGAPIDVKSKYWIFVLGGIPGQLNSNQTITREEFEEIISTIDNIKDDIAKMKANFNWIEV